MKRRLKGVVTWLCLFAVFFGLTPGAFGQAANSGGLEPGQLELTKEAKPTGTRGEWEITLTARGKGVETNSDVVLVIDKSGSMKDNSRMKNAKAAAKTFVDKLLVKGSKTRIAVVTFSGEGNVDSEFTQDKAALVGKWVKDPKGKDKWENGIIDKISADGGTNIQAGIYQARTLLKDKSTAQNKVIILLSDGEPTYSFKAKSASPGEWKYNNHSFVLSNFEYGTQIGSGSKFDLKYTYDCGMLFFPKTCTYDDSYRAGNYNITNNGIGTISEAKLATDNNIDIYSVGLDVADKGRAINVLKEVSEGQYYPSTSDQLEQIFERLTGKINYAAKDAIVTDPMGEGFNLKLNGDTLTEADYYASDGTVELATIDGVQTLIWKVGTVGEEPATLTYRVKIDISKRPDPSKQHDTNGRTWMEYEDVYGNKGVEKDFPMPNVGIEYGTILVNSYAVNAMGEPIDNNGQVVDSPEKAKLLDSNYFSDGGHALLDFKEYTVQVPEEIDAGYYFKTGENPSKVMLTKSDFMPTLWFGYSNSPFKLTVEHRVGDRVLKTDDFSKNKGEAIDYGYSNEAFAGYHFTNAEVSEGSGLNVDNGHVTGVMPGKDVTITFNYTAKQTVIVKYVDRKTDTLLGWKKEIGFKGDKITLTAPEFDGYTAEEPSQEYTFSADKGQVVVFYYTANSTEPDDNRTVTVRYVDKDTQKDLIPSQPHTGKVGEVITLTATDYKDSVTGVVYQPHTYEVPYTFTEDQVQQFVFEYTQDKSNLERSVTIHHVDLESNEELIAPTTELGYAGRTLVLYPEPISVTDAVYYPEQLEYGFEITLDSVQEFTIYYTKGEPTDLAQLTVSYLDRETGAELAAPEMIKGRIGDKIELTAKEVLGYTPETVKYTHEFIDDPNQAHVFYYTKNAPADRQLTVKYLENGTNRQLASPTVVTGKPGETKTLAALSVSGYTPVKSTDTYTFNDKEGQEFIFYYTRNSSNPGGSDNSGDSGNSGNSGDSGNPTPPSTPEVTPLPPLPAVPPTLDTENHFQYIHGYPDGSVKPLNNITREEVATIFYRLLDDESRSAYLKTGTDLSDVEAKRWSNPFISTMENAGIVTGYPNGTFKPGQYITRAEFAAIASRFDKLDERPNDMFTDIKGHWAEKYIASAANKGWINGYTDGTFKPDQYITRAEAAKFINSVLNRKVDEAGLHEDAKMWPDNAKGMWYYYEILEATNHHDYSREDSDVEVWNEVKPNRVYP